MSSILLTSCIAEMAMVNGFLSCLLSTFHRSISSFADPAVRGTADFTSHAPCSDRRRLHVSKPPPSAVLHTDAMLDPPACSRRSNPVVPWRPCSWIVYCTSLLMSHSQIHCATFSSKMLQPPPHPIASPGDLPLTQLAAHVARSEHAAIISMAEGDFRASANHESRLPRTAMWLSSGIPGPVELYQMMHLSNTSS